MRKELDLLQEQIKEVALRLADKKRTPQEHIADDKELSELLSKKKKLMKALDKQL